MRALTIPIVAFYTAAVLSCGGNDGDTDKLDLVGKRDAQSPAKAKAGRPDVQKSAPDGPLGDTFVIDLIQDLVFRYQRDGWTLTTPSAHVTVPKLQKGGVHFVLSAIPQSVGPTRLKDVEKSLLAMEALAGETAGRVTLVSSFEAATKAHADGVIPMGILMEGADVFVDHPERLVDLKKRGLMAVGLVGGRNNAFADAAVSPRKNGGLTEKGAAFVDACRDAGIVVDLTHASPATFWDTMVRQAGKVMVSHTAARALMEHPRNLNDLQILALSRYGGVMGLLFNPEFLKLSGTASLRDVVEHMSHIKAIGAVEALALGTDYGGIRPPQGLDDVSMLPRVAKALQAQGMSTAEIKGVFGGHAARLFNEISREYGEVTITPDDILRPVAADCESVIGEFEGALAVSCDNYLREPGALIAPASKLKVRIRDMTKTPVKLELFGEPDVPWQAEGQNLEGKILFHRFVKLDERGIGSMSLPQNRNLTRMFFSPTRTSALREVVVWGRTPVSE